MKNSVLDDVNALNLEYRSGARFKHFLRMSKNAFYTTLNMIDSKISKMDTKFRKLFLRMNDSFHVDLIFYFIF